jgi:hypothetical protein
MRYATSLWPPCSGSCGMAMTASGSFMSATMREVSSSMLADPPSAFSAFSAFSTGLKY